MPKFFGHFWVPDVFLDVYGSQLQPTTIVVYFALCRWADKEGDVSFGTRKLSAYLQMSRMTTFRALKELEDHQLISKAKNTRTKNGVRSVRRVSQILDHPVLKNRHTPSQAPLQKVSVWNRNNMEYQVYLKNRTGYVKNSDGSVTLK